MKHVLLISLTLFLLGGQAILAQSPSAQRVAYDYSDMYMTLNPSIVKVHCDSGHGSGFLVSSKGLIATNHHVVANSRYLAVEFADGRKVRAEVAVLNPRYDFAVLKVNSTVVAGLKPLPLVSAEKESALRAGTPVVALGSPRGLTFLITQGVVSKVEENSLLGDFLIQPGNSGGPLVNLDGEVVGINTFLAYGSYSGAVRSHIVRDALARVESADESIVEPPADQLPMLSGKRYPTEALKEKVLNDPLEESVYVLDGGKFTVTALTPVLIAKKQIQADLLQSANRYKRRGKKIKDPSYSPIDEPYYEWARDASEYLETAVTFEIKPDFGTTTGSKWAVGLAALAGGMRAANSVTLNMEYKAEFDDFKLYRDGRLVEPVKPGRAITEAAFAGMRMVFVDEAYSGVYVYDPSIFLSGDEFRIEIYDAREPGKIHKTVNLKADSKLIKQIRADFAGVDAK